MVETCRFGGKMSRADMLTDTIVRHGPLSLCDPWQLTLATLQGDCCDRIGHEQMVSTSCIMLVAADEPCITCSFGIIIYLFLRLMLRTCF